MKGNGSTAELQPGGACVIAVKCTFPRLDEPGEEITGDDLVRAPDVTLHAGDRCTLVRWLNHQRHALLRHEGLGTHVVASVNHFTVGRLA